MIDETPQSHLQEARDHFHAMLRQKTEERDWQRFFAKYPYVLSRALPLRVEPSDIIPLGRPGRTEPDFIFYPHNNITPPLFGMFEIKRPDSPIVTVTRSNVAILSRDARTAVEQLRQFERQAQAIIPAAPDTTLFIGNKAYLFAIIGKSSELIEKLSTELYREMLQQTLPGNLQILPYDILLKRFERTLPQKIFLLVPAPPTELSPQADKLAMFHWNGRHWEVVFDGGKPLHLDDALGARYLNYLLHHPNVTISAFDLEVLITPEKGEARTRNSIQPQSDARALRQYAWELRRLLAERQEVEATGDRHELDRLEREIYALRTALQGPKLADNGKRARDNVWSAIRRFTQQLDRGGSETRSLADHLRSNLSIGVECLYSLPPGRVWG